MSALAGPQSKLPPDSRGFTLVELLVTLVVLGVVMVALMAVLFGANRSRTATMNQLESIQAVRAGLDLMTRDLRSAGYGAEFCPFLEALHAAFAGRGRLAVQAESRFRPRARRAAMTLRPPFSPIRARKPCRRLRTSLLG